MHQFHIVRTTCARARSHTVPVFRSQMPAQVAFAVIHGMGAQDATFADAFLRDVRARVAAHGVPPAALEVASIWWGDLFQVDEDDLWRRMTQAHRLDWGWLRRFVMGVLADAVAYRRPNPGQYDHYQAIHQRVHERLADLSERAGSTTPLVVAAHSLGSVIFSDHVWDEQRRRGPGRDPLTRCETLAGLITFGSNIPLFTLGLDQVKPIAFPPPGNALSEPVRAAARWMNYFDRDDVLGYPLREISPAYADTVSADVPLKVGTLLSNWNPASHTGYWNDATFVDRVAAQVAAVAEAGDQ